MLQSTCFSPLHITARYFARQHMKTFVITCIHTLTDLSQCIYFDLNIKLAPGLKNAQDPF